MSYSKSTQARHVCLFKGNLISLASSRSFKPIFDNYMTELINTHYFYIGNESPLIPYYIDKMLRTNNQDRFLYLWSKLTRLKRDSFPS